MTSVLNPAHPGWDALTSGDRRNVIDQFKWMDDEEVRSTVAEAAAPGIVAVENIESDLNAATVLRSTNAFNLSEFWLVGRRRWDRRGAVGVHNYTPVKHGDHPDTVIPQFKAAGYSIVAIDNVPGSIPLSEHVWTPNTVIWFGQESIGVSNEALAAADAIVHIPMYGSVRSLNVASAAAIILHDYRASLETGLTA